LTHNQKSFIELMNKSEEHARRGFDLLAKRADVERFFDELQNAGLFEAKHNPAPVSVDSEGSIRVPYWSALGYLLACAKSSNIRGDNALAANVITVVRSVSAFREPDGTIRDNFHTFRTFAEILGALPTTAVATADVDLVQLWLSSRFDQGMVARALDVGAFKRFLASDVTEDWQKAIILLRHCLEIRWRSARRGSVEDDDPLTVVDAYWLKELLDHHAHDFGKKLGKEAAAVVGERVREVFSRGGRASWSYVFRPAVEDHSQNHSWKTTDNILVEGLRDIVLSWCDVDSVAAKPFVKDLLCDEIEMLRRIGLFVLSEKWSVLGALYSHVITSDLFDLGHIHELYGLLSKHFEELDDGQKAATLTSIRGLPAPEGEDSESRLKRVQWRWLSSLSETKYEPAAEWIAGLATELKVGVPEHPDFNTYTESFYGPGTSAYQVLELVAFAEQGCIIEKLNAFKPKLAWRSPSIEALTSTLEQAIVVALPTFARALPAFLDAALPYQVALVRGFKNAWDAHGDQQAGTAWDDTWQALIGFFERLLTNPELGKTTEGVGDATRNGLVSSIADLLHAGIRDDDHSYAPTLLVRGWSLLQLLVEQAEGVQNPDEDDAMTQAINSSKGRAIEAIFAHVLRECHFGDKTSASHADAWARAEPVFDRELKKCESGNFEFSTLVGANITSLDYFDDGGWLRANLAQIFPTERPATFRCALGGFAYSVATPRIYAMLRDGGVVDASLRLDLRGRDTRKQLIERIMLAYLWNEEPLNSPRFSYLFESGRVEDLEEGARFLWSVRGEQLSADQREKVIAFWRECVTWAGGQATAPAKLLSCVANLAWSLEDVTEGHLELLLAVAPYVGIGHGTYEFIEQLRRLVDVNPLEVSTVLAKLIETYEITYDYEDTMKSLIARLAELGQRSAALDYCAQLRNLSGMPELFARLTGGT
jgi:hypothetical protein